MSSRVLSSTQVEEFLGNGFTRVEGAFSTEVAAECRAICWQETGCDPNDPATWTEPVIRLGSCAQEPFRTAANTPRLLGAFDQLVGAGRWLPRKSIGSIPIRFPHPRSPGDDGWHIDGSYHPEEPKSGPPWVNVRSRGRALLMLFLFSDTAENDAPTRIRVGSHLDVPSRLEAAGEDGMSTGDLAATGLFEATADLPQVLATGEAGDVYLCHPFLVHAAQPHCGTSPRFLAQPPLYPAAPFQLERANGGYSPVELAIRRGMAGRAAGR
ncbi:phytanoyl-CoA dioxygenase family protein [Streptomyces sp. P9(2023)]|uniref:phytanoyl-CoA dioxygenase family protein n=1 Tax=Streptomyces sp. P9(2023) TaxID=3064394 RepID=UPI0028F44331|nr:phytanoyl-CoA dioxygenase family protein [Streptomyces sp. P9(2023)]MDT9689493.1 phytanoyl-CoA dioxygenase family protein [Streptomyces sp. P9(2023)]